MLAVGNDCTGYCQHGLDARRVALGFALPAKLRMRDRNDVMQHQHWLDVGSMDPVGQARPVQARVPDIEPQPPAAWLRLGEMTYVTCQPRCKSQTECQRRTQLWLQIVVRAEKGKQGS